MVGVVLTAIAFHSVPAPADLAYLLDRELLEYRSRALEADRSGLRQKALAMLQLLLLPEQTLLSVDFGGVPESAKDTFERGLNKGIALWREALGSDMPIRFAKPGEKADIVLRFVEKVGGGDSRCKGEIRAKRWIQWNEQVHYQQFSATVSVCKFAEGRLMFESEITHIVAHELGHALGLGDNSSTGYIMGPVELGRPYAKLNSSEVEAVRSFRQQVRDEMAKMASHESRAVR